MKLTTLFDNVAAAFPGSWLSRPLPLDIHACLPGCDADPKTGAVYVCALSELPQSAPENTVFFCAQSAVAHGLTVSAPPEGCALALFSCTGAQLLAAVCRALEEEQRQNRSISALTALLTPGGGLQPLADAAFGLLKTPLVIADANGKTLALSGLAPESLRGPALTEAAARAGMSGAEAGAAALQACGASWLYIPLEAHGVWAAGIFIMQTESGSPHGEAGLYRSLAKLAALELEGELREADTGAGQALLTELLEGRRRGRDAAAEARAKRLGWRTEGGFRLLCVLDNEYGGGRRARLLLQQLSRLLPGGHGAPYENRIVFLLPANCDKNEQALCAYLAANRLVAAFSLPCDSLTELPGRYAQCNAALELGCLLRPSAVLHSYGDYVCQHLGSLAGSTLPLSTFFHPQLPKIAACDAAGRSELLPTLRAYLAHPGDPSAAAKELFIHKNTLFYRIAKLKEQFGLQLESGSERLHIQLTLALMELQSAHPQP